jgi:transposase
MKTSPRPAAISVFSKQNFRLLQKMLTLSEAALKRERYKTDRLTLDIGKMDDRYTRLQQVNHKVLHIAREKEKQNAELLAALESANKQLSWFRKQYFGHKTESNPFDTEHDGGEEEEEEEDDDGDDENEKPTEPPIKRKRGQQAGSKGHGRTDTSGIPEDDPEIISLKSACCPSCSLPYSEFPDTEDSSIVEFETRIFKRKIKRKRYAVRCKCTKQTIITAPPAPKLYKKTSIGNTLWVHLLVQKMLYGTPTNRILKDLALKGLGLSPGTVTGGFKVIEGLLEPLYSDLKTYCQSEKMWNADETSWHVYEDQNGTRSGKKWWLWVIAGQRSVVYVLDKSRSRAVPEEFFGASKGTLISDRFGAYKTLSTNISKAFCWVHVRRDFLKVFEGVSKLRNWSRQWLLDIAELFVLNHNRFKLWTENQTIGKVWFAANMDLSNHIDQLQKNWSAQLRTAVHSEQKTILNSLKRHWKGLTLFLENPCIPLDNNRAERLLRGCVVQRKNSYGNGIEWSGNLSAMCFSLMQTWLINGLDPERMLLAYFNECSKTSGSAPLNCEDFLPWNMAKEKLLEFALPASYKRPG